MGYLKNLRNGLGISQDAFATLIACKPSLLSMAESGRRDLPDNSYPLLAELEITLMASMNGPDDVQLGKNEATAQLNRHVRVCRDTKISLMFAVEKVTEQMRQARHLLRVGTSLRNRPLFNESGLPGMQLDVLLRKAEHKWQQCRNRYIHLQISIAGLEAEIAKAGELEAVLDEIGLAVGGVSGN